MRCSAYCLWFANCGVTYEAGSRGVTAPLQVETAINLHHLYYIIIMLEYEAYEVTAIYAVVDVTLNRTRGLRGLCTWDDGQFLE